MLRFGRSFRSIVSGRGIKTATDSSLSEMRSKWFDIPINISGIRQILDHDNHQLRNDLRKFLSSKDMAPQYNLPLVEERKSTLLRLKSLCSANFFSVMDHEKDPNRIFAVNELCAIVDPSMAFKICSHFSLYGGTILRLGTEKHQNILHSVARLEDIGCFATSEGCFGDKVDDIEITAELDPKTNEIVINTPTTEAAKYCVVNNSLHALHCVLLAKLIVNGQHQGIHAFIVPLQGSDSQAVDGVTIEDMGYKIGLNGVDCARVAFTGVRIPCDSMLDRYSKFSTDGKFHTSLEDFAGERFHQVFHQLSSGRIAVACMCSGATKASLAIALAYSAAHLTIGPTGKLDTPIWDHRLQQQSLLPLLARTYAVHFALSHLKDEWTRVLKCASEEKSWTSVYLMSSVLKSIASWDLVNTANICRERTGVEGYLACNRFGSYLGLGHAAITSMGANAPLMQRACKIRFKQLLNSWGGKLPDISCIEFNDHPETIEDVDYLHDLVKKRELSLFSSLARRISGLDREQVQYLLNYELSDLVQASSRAYGESLCSTHFSANLVPHIRLLGPETVALLRKVYRLFLLHSLAYAVEWPSMPADFTAFLREEVRYACVGLAPDALPLAMDAFGLSPGLLHAPVVKAWADWNARQNLGGKKWKGRPGA
ncbi:unnamed protein product [Calicophoron daubneyi]|uniref:Acyl-CoA oxidase C-alpha1 domain-containing protein n=1 Tax=Calicophoron daubneyi TaxID=300641 RepID=A0AAV2T5Q0_CALDB